MRLIWTEEILSKYPERITREVDAFGPLNLKEITVEIGLRKPFDVMHVSDTHIARADARDNERKIMLAARRSQHMNAGEHYLDEAVRIARERGMYLFHTGDLHDFVSEANLDMDARHMIEGDWFEIWLGRKANEKVTGGRIYAGGIIIKS